jgi:hypothetical protein
VAWRSGVAQWRGGAVEGRAIGRGTSPPDQVSNRASDIHPMPRIMTALVRQSRLRNEVGVM